MAGIDRPPRVAVRAVLVHEARLLLVNAWPSGTSDLWCAPGGGMEPGQSLPDNLAREVKEETGLTVAVGPPCLVNEFHDPPAGFHQVEVFFRCRLLGGAATPPGWSDPEGVVTERRWVSAEEIGTLRYKPDALPRLAWPDGAGDAPLLYDPLELMGH